LALLNGRLSFNVMFDYQENMTQYNSLGLIYLASSAMTPGATFAQEAMYQAALMSPTYSGQNSRYLYQTIDMWRWNSASISYLLPTSWAHRVGGQSVRLSVQGSNLWVHSNYRGKDPNVNANIVGSGSEGVADIGQLPQPRTVVVGLSISN
jgi:hypothetical protein